MRFTIKRRDFLKVSALAAAGAVLAACQPTVQPTSAPATGGEGEGSTETTFKGNVELWGQTYTPTASMEWSEDNPLPHNMIKVLADEYHEKNPDATVTIIEKPAAVADHEWIVTNQAGGTIPHIVWTHRFWVDGEVDKGWWVPLDDYFNEPNPYIEAGKPGSAVWKEVFYEVPFGATVAVDGHFYTVPLDLVTTFFFYNKNIFDKVGLKAPMTWTEHMNNLKALQESGVIPITHLGWYESQIGWMLYGKKEKLVNKDGGICTLQEVACAIKNGIYRATDIEYKTWLEYAKGYIPFCNPDWAAADPQHGTKFLNQQIAIYEDGSWRFGSLRANPLLEFEWSTFYSPTITPEDNPLATGDRAIPIGGPTSAQWSVATRAEKDGILATAIDVLRWYTAPQNGGRMIAELASFLPNLKGADVNPDLKEPLKAISEGLGESSMFTYGDKVDTETREKMAPIWTDAKIGAISIEDAQKQLDVLMAEYADAAIAKNNWTC